MKTTTSDYDAETILVVDDDDKFRTQLAQYLRDEGFQIVEANSSSDACALIRERKVSLVLLDWDLHRRNSFAEDSSTGFEVIRTCHEVDGLLPVVAMSGARDFDARSDSMMAGADGFLQKPFALPLLTKPAALDRQTESRKEPIHSANRWGHSEGRYGQSCLHPCGCRKSWLSLAGSPKTWT